LQNIGLHTTNQIISLKHLIMLMSKCSRVLRIASQICETMVLIINISLQPYKTFVIFMMYT
jgi:hypothetical protein